MSDIKIRYLWIEVPSLDETLDKWQQDLLIRMNILIKQEMCKHCMKLGSEFAVEDVKITISNKTYFLSAYREHADVDWDKREKVIEEYVENFHKPDVQSFVISQAHVCNEKEDVLKHLYNKINKLKLKKKKNSTLCNFVKKTRKGKNTFCEKNKKSKHLKKDVYSTVLKSSNKNFVLFCTAQYLCLYASLNLVISELNKGTYTHSKDMRQKLFARKSSIIMDIAAFTYYIYKKTLRYEDIRSKKRFNINALRSQLAACSLVNDVSATLKTKRIQSNHILQSTHKILKNL